MDHPWRLILNQVRFANDSSANNEYRCHRAVSETNNLKAVLKIRTKSVNELDVVKPMAGIKTTLDLHNKTLSKMDKKMEHQPKLKVQHLSSNLS